jgi:hypothetical protein
MWRACSAVALAFCLFKVFLCCARVLCVPDLTVALLGIALGLEIAGADWLVCAQAYEGDRATSAPRTRQAILLSTTFLQIGSFDRDGRSRNSMRLLR